MHLIQYSNSHTATAFTINEQIPQDIQPFAIGVMLCEHTYTQHQQWPGLTVHSFNQDETRLS